MKKNDAISQLNNLLSETNSLPVIKGRSELIRKLKGSIQHLKMYKDDLNAHLFVKECSEESKMLINLVQNKEQKMGRSKKQ